jgi:YTV
MPRTKFWTAALIASVGVSSNVARAQVCEPSYKLVPTTEMVERKYTTYRLEYEDRFEEKEIVSYKPVVTERVEKRQYTVRKPVIETSTVNETYTVLKPVKKTSYVDQSYTQTEYVTETSQKEETVVTYRPIVETQYQTQHVIVQRPITETQYQTQNYTTFQPVTTYQPAVVDQGGYVANQYVRPGDTRYHLRWMSGGAYVDPLTGQAGYRRGGLGWVPYSSQPQVLTQLAYKPNYQQVQIPQTSYMPQTVQQQIPVQVTRVENQVVEQQVPVQVQKMQAVEEKRVVPYSVQKPVTKVITNKVPVETTEWVQEQHVRPVSVQRESFKLETVSEDVPIKTYSTERVVEKVRVPVRVVRRVPVEETRLEPRTVYYRVPHAYYDPFATSIRDNWSSFPTTISSSAAPITAVPAKAETAGAATPAANQGSNQSVQKVEVSKPEDAAKKAEEKSKTDEKLPNGKSEDEDDQLKIGPSLGDASTGTGLRPGTPDKPNKT